MRGKKTHRLLSILLVVVMLLSVLPMTAMADSTAETTDDSSFYKIVHLDCGRKYFTKDWIVALINEIAADGYNQLQLAFGNDGLRFLLNDMSFTANSTTYSHADVVFAVETGNAAQNSSGDTRWLTETEMDEIIAVANSKDIEIVPLLNLPGHANAILDIANDTYNVSGSNNTLDMSKTDAVNFGMAIFQKYVDYFAKKGCKFFSFGADEYANDISGGSFSFGRLNSDGYQSFVDFINNMAAYIESKGMTPRAFNDGLYYDLYTSVSIDKKIQCCYWSSGWNGYSVASASTIADKGHSMINTHGDFYYVLGKADKFDSGYSYAANWNNSTYQGSTISDSAGSMFCIWCDFPNAETETEIAANVRLTLRAMESRMDGESLDNLDTATVVSGGFNADGSINKTSIQKDGTTISNFTVKVGQTATLSLSDSAATATWYSSNENVATVTAMSRSVEANSVIVNPVGEGTATITAALSDGTSLTTEVTVTAAGTTDEPEYTDTIVLEVGGQTEKIISDYNYEKDYEVTDSTIVDVNVNGTDATEPTTTYTKASVTCADLLSSNSNNWTAVDGYYYKTDDGNYYPVYAKRSSEGLLFWYTYYYTWGYSTTNSSSNVKEIGTQETDSTSTKANIIVYTKSGTDATPASTTVTFTGLKPGETTVRVGTFYYKVIVNYKTQIINAVIDQDTQVNVSGIADTSKLDTSIATVSISNGIMTVTGKSEGETEVTVGDTIYTIKVIKEDLSNVADLTVEFWITNQQVTAYGDTSMAIKASDADVYSESGALFSSLVPASGTQSGNTMDFWKGTRLASDNKQTTDGGVDKTNSGTDFTYIRYWNASWAYSSDGKAWTNVESGDQIVAYYLQRTDVTDEITTQVVDWGPKKANWSDLNYLGIKYVLIDYTVKYESGEETPSSFPTDNSLSFHCDTLTKEGSYYYRTLGMIRGVETADYEVYMITVTPTNNSPSTVLAATAAGNTSYKYRGTEVVAWAATEDELDNSGLGSYTSISGKYTYSIGGEPIVSGLEIYRQQGMKVTFYVRAKQTEDSLSVHYIDQTVNSEFYSYNIAVLSGTMFDKNIGLDNPWKSSLVNGSVTNSLGKVQTVSADLSTMPAIGAQYRYSEYTCVEVVRSSDGKDVYLYYTFNNAHSFVIDFGLPLTITTSDLGISGDWTDADITGEKYGDATAGVGEGVNYTPNKVLLGVETLQLTLKDNTGTRVTHQIYIYPASNVLYEDTFLASADVWDGWNVYGSSANKTQSTDQNGLYGFDSAYSDVANYSNGTAWVASGLSESNLSTKKLTTSFYGYGFDLIGECAPDTAMVYLVIKGADGKAVKGAIVDTRFADDSVNNSHLYQVPLAHLMLEEGAYTAEVSAYYVAAPAASSNTQTASTFSISRASAGSDLSALYEIIDAAYEDDLDLDDIEFLYFDESSPIASMNQSVAMYAAVETPTADITATTSVKEAGTRSVIDGFRVYRSSDNSAYLSTEKNVEYVNVLKAVTGNIAGYIEGNADGTYTKADYESSGGPQNEIYLPVGKAVTFQTNLDENGTVQISARAVSGIASLNGASLSSNTEMYYKVTVGSNGVITVTNTAGATGMLAIANLKLPKGTVLSEPTEATYAVAFSMLRSFSETPVEPEPEPDPVFTPDKLDIKVNSRAIGRNRIITFSITASKDVAKLTVNGNTILPTNALLVKRGYLKYYTFVFMDYARQGQAKSYEIIAYNADGVASEVYTVDG